VYNSIYYKKVQKTFRHMNNSVLTFVGLGEILWDRYGDKKYLGGAPCNFVLNIHQLGHRGIIYSRIGSDKKGEEMIKALRQRGLEIRFIQRDRNKPTASVSIKLKPGNRPLFTCANTAVFNNIRWNPEWENYFSSVHGIYFGSLCQRSPDGRNGIQSILTKITTGIKFYDINLQQISKIPKEIIIDSIKYADIVKCNKKEFAHLIKIICQEGEIQNQCIQRILQEYNIKIFILTLGKYGCVVYTHNESVYSPGYKVNVIDPVGCGDAFAAAFIIKYCQGRTLTECGSYANLAGAYLATKMSATPVYTPSDIARFADTHPQHTIDPHYATLRIV